MNCFLVIVVAIGWSFTLWLCIMVKYRLLFVFWTHPLFSNSVQMFSELLLLFFWSLYPSCGNVFTFSCLPPTVCASHRHEEVIFWTFVVYGKIMCNTSNLIYGTTYTYSKKSQSRFETLVTRYTKWAPSSFPQKNSTTQRDGSFGEPSFPWSRFFRYFLFSVLLLAF